MVFFQYSLSILFPPGGAGGVFSHAPEGKNAVLLLASLIFLRLGELRLLPLMVFTILLVCGLGIERSRNRKKLWLLASIVISVGLLGFSNTRTSSSGSLNAVTGLKNSPAPFGAARRHQLLHLPDYELHHRRLPRQRPGAEKALSTSARMSPCFPN